jgi:FAD/FMN-containing dehydrogenase
LVFYKRLEGPGKQSLVYNGMIDKRPKLIVRAVDVGDLMAAVSFGRKNGLLTAIRGGGHNGTGLGTCDGGLLA